MVSATSFGVNLIANGDAEANSVTDFTFTPGLQTLSYSYGGGFPVAGDPGVSEGELISSTPRKPASLPPAN